jgi:hypothetical protein
MWIAQGTEQNRLQLFERRAPCTVGHGFRTVPLKENYTAGCQLMCVMRDQHSQCSAFYVDFGLKSECSPVRETAVLHTPVVMRSYQCTFTHSSSYGRYTNLHNYAVTQINLGAGVTELSHAKISHNMRIAQGTEQNRLQLFERGRCAP